MTEPDVIDRIRSIFLHERPHVTLADATVFLGWTRGDMSRLIDIHLRIPRHHVAMLEHFAERDHTTVSAALTREFDGIAMAHVGELSWALGGFADALAWPAPMRTTASLLTDELS
jgi:hypothetical protein